MDNNVNIISSEAEDIFILKDNLRAEDIAECKATGYTPLQSLLDGYVFSDECFTIKIKDKVEGMFGVSSYKQPEGCGLIWCLCSDILTHYPIAFVRKGRYHIKEWLKKYKILWNSVDKRNITHINWLKHIGFTFTEEIDVNNYKFLQFYTSR